MSFVYIFMQIDWDTFFNWIAVWLPYSTDELQCRGHQCPPNHVRHRILSRSTQKSRLLCCDQAGSFRKLHQPPFVLFQRQHHHLRFFLFCLVGKGFFFDTNESAICFDRKFILFKYNSNKQKKFFFYSYRLKSRPVNHRVKCVDVLVMRTQWIPVAEHLNNPCRWFALEYSIRM